MAATRFARYREVIVITMITFMYHNCLASLDASHQPSVQCLCCIVASKDAHSEHTLTRVTFGFVTRSSFTFALSLFSRHFLHSVFLSEDTFRMSFNKFFNQTLAITPSHLINHSARLVQPFITLVANCRCCRINRSLTCAAWPSESCLHLV